MQNKKSTDKKHAKKKTELEEFFAEDRFDEEDEDSVTDDTLEFLCLDDDEIEAYQSGGKSAGRTPRKSASGHRDEEEDDEAYYEDEEDDEEYYEDEDEEDDEYYEDEEDDEEYYEDDDEDYEDEEYDDRKRGVAARFWAHLADMSTLDMVVAMFGIFVTAGVIVTGTLFVNAKTIEKQVAAFASVGEEVEGVSVIGEGGLVAVSESARLSGMLELEEEEQEAQEEEQKDGIEVTLNLTSIQSDLKIKFVNKATGKLISGVPFEVEVSGGGKTFDLKDDDKDGIIYETGVAAGTYSVKAKALAGGEYAGYKFPTAATKVTVSDKIAYKKVDVADEIKDESQINVAAEEKATGNVAVESQLTDTVEWVESTKTPIDSEENFSEIGKDQIPDPAKSGRAIGGFMKLVSDNNVDKCTCAGRKKCTSTEDADGCPVCEKDPSQCEGSEPDAPTGPTAAQKLETLSISGSLTLKVGESGTVTVSGEYVSEASIDWKSSSDSVSVSGSGAGVTVKGEKKGEAAVTATVTIGGEHKDLSCTVTVQEAELTGQQKVDSYTINKTSLTLTAGKTETLTVSSPGNYSVSVDWTSDDTNIATVNRDTGEVKAVAAGKTKIKARVSKDGKEKILECALTVTNDAASDNKTKLKDKNGNQVYVRKDGRYVEATYEDYYTADKFYLAKSMYRYTGWQTIDGSVYFFDKNGNYVTGEQVIQGAKYNFGSDGRLSAGSGSMGIDVSKHNGSIDWNAVRNSGVSYVIIRCGYRGYSTGVLVEDPKFASNIKGAKAAGLKVGVYIYSQAVNEVEAVEEASMALNLVKGYGLDYPIFIDVEASGGRGDGIDRGTRTAVCQAFCQTVQNSGYSAGVYSNKNWFSEQISTGSLTGYKIWLAQYAASPTYTATRYDMWQYSSKGKVSGISGNVDMNISYLNY